MHPARTPFWRGFAAGRPVFSASSDFVDGYRPSRVRQLTFWATFGIPGDGVRWKIVLQGETDALH